MKKGLVVFVLVLAIAASYVIYTQIGLTIQEVRSDTVREDDIKINLELAGKIQPRNKVDITSQSGGVVEEIYVKEGNIVDKGEILFSFDTTEAEQQLDAALSTLENLRSEQLKQSTQEVFAPSEKIVFSQYAQNAISLAQSSGYELFHFNNEITNLLAQAAADRLVASAGGDLQSIIQSYLPQITSVLNLNETSLGNTPIQELLDLDEGDSLEAKIISAKANVKTLEDRLDSMKVSSTISGKVLEINVKNGETLMPGSAAVVIADTKDMEVRATVSDRDVDLLKIGTKATIVSGSDGRKYDGTIESIGQVIMESDILGSENMTETVIHPDERLFERPGSNVNLVIVIKQKKDVPVISLECLTADEFVFVIDEKNIIHKKAVKTGLRDNYNVEVLSGIELGENLVSNPDESLQEGQKVKVVD